MKRKTVADRIRGMTNDELNSFLQIVVDGHLSFFDDVFCRKICPHRRKNSGCELGDEGCNSLGWSEKEAIRSFMEADADILDEKEKTP